MKATRQDRQLEKLVKALETGSHVTENERFYLDPLELGLQNGILMRGHRVMIPQQLRNKILKELHTVHFEIFKMKSLARWIVWWPGTNTHIEEIARLSL